MPLSVKLINNFSSIKLSQLMEELDSENRQYFDRVKQRDYGCPCGKSYLSYAALFTHIKQKHDGKAPGQITKPSSMYPKRGRPSSKNKQKPQQDLALSSNTKKQNAENQQKEEECVKRIPEITQSQRAQKEEQILQSAAQILEHTSSTAILNKSQLNQIEAFTEMTVMVSKVHEENSESSDSSQLKKLGPGIIQFLKGICPKVKWDKFEQVYILTMIFLQYIIDEENTKRVLKDEPLDIVCRYVNDFCEEHMVPMTEYYQVQNLGIFQEDKHIRIFGALFEWMDCKDYSRYDVKLDHRQSDQNENEPKLQSNAHII